MKIKHLKSIFISIVVCSILIGGLIFFKKNQKTSNEFKDYFQVVEGWKIYKNEKFGYIVQYPQDWTIIKTQENQGIVLSNVTFQSNDYEEKINPQPETVEGLWRTQLLSKGTTLIFNVVRIPPDPNWCIGLFEDNPQKCTWHYWAKRGTDWPYGKILNQEFITLNEREVYKKEIEYQNITSIVISFSDLEEKILFEFIIDTLTKDKERSLELLEQVISNFEFLNGEQAVGKETSDNPMTEIIIEPEENLTPRQVVERFLEADTLGARLGGEIDRQVPDIKNYRSSNFLDPGWDTLMVIKKYEIINNYPSEEDSYFVDVKYFCEKGIASGFTGAKDEEVIMIVPSDVPGGEGMIVSFGCDNFFSPLADPSIIKYDFENQTETITFKLIKENGKWKMDAPLTRPHISEETLIKHLENLAK